MFVLTALAYVLGLISLILYSLAHRSALTRAIGPLYPLQGAFLLVTSLVAFGMAWQAVHEFVCLPLRDGETRPAAAVFSGLRTLVGFAGRIVALTSFFFVLLALICPFLPKEFAYWYDPLVVAGAIGWIYWWRALRDAEERNARAPS